MLVNGVNLIYIRDILGHAVVTTEVHAKANSDEKSQVQAGPLRSPRCR